MSNLPALAQPYAEPARGEAPVDLCERIYRRNFAEHLAAQESINNDWAALLQSPR